MCCVLKTDGVTVEVKKEVDDDDDDVPLVSFPSLSPLSQSVIVIVII